MIQAGKACTTLALVLSLAVGCVPNHVMNKQHYIHKKTEQFRQHTLIHDYLNIEISSGLVDSSGVETLDDLISGAQKLYTPETNDDPLTVLGQIDTLLIENNWVYAPNLFLANSLAPRQLPDEVKDFFRDHYVENMSLSSIYSSKCSDETKEFLRINYRKLDHIAQHADEGFHFADCDNLTHAYLAMIESLNKKGLELEAYGVRAPRHMFLCAHSDKGKVWWETVYGKEHSIDYFQKRYRITDNAVKRGTYLNDLTRKESILSHAHCVVGYRLVMLGETKEAIWHFDQAIRLDPTYASAYAKLGSALSLDGNYVRASLLRAQHYWLIGGAIH